MNETPKTKHGWRILRRIVIGLAILATLIAIFYTEEDWRGKRDWENCKRELEAKGAVLDWDKYIPPLVPDDQNFFAAPKMQEWFVGRGETELSKRLTNPTTSSVGTMNAPQTAAAARDYLAWSDQFGPDFDLVRQALKRPYARMVGNYTQPYSLPVPNFLTVRIFAQTLAQRAHCYFLLDEPQKALEELTFLNDSRHLLEGAPTGKPMTLVDAMINIAVTGLYANTIAEGFKLRMWQDSQLISLQEQLGRVNLIPCLSEAFREAPAHDYQFVKQLEAGNRQDRKRMKSLFSRFPNSWIRNWNDPVFLLLDAAPKGWIDQNLATVVRSEEKVLDALDTSNSLVFPQRIDTAMREIQNGNSNHSPYRILASFAIPNYSRAIQTLAHYQTLANQDQMACALERYRLAHGEYPETLDALVPQFIEKLPHDIIGGQTSQGFGPANQPLHYRRTADGKFLLYSVGWNETDDNGQASPVGQDGGIDFSQGDWVWQSQPK